MTVHFNYKDTLARAEKISWRVEDIIGGDKTLDFSKPFLPEALARVTELGFLNEEEQRVLNQIRGHGYLYTFGMVEEFILPFVMDHARSLLDTGDDFRIRSLLQFASEEAKHIHLFKRFQEEFAKGFPVKCDVIGPPEAIAAEVLSHNPLAITFAILGIEWLTQRHYTESVRDDADLDSQFKSLLKHHWMEEMQHAQLDALMALAIAEPMSADERAAAADDYLQIGLFLDGGLAQQAEFDLDAFERATGRMLTDQERTAFRTSQHQALRWTFLGSGLTHPQFVETVQAITPEGAGKIAGVAPAFC